MANTTSIAGHPPAMRTILLVDSDSAALATLVQSLKKLKPDWNILQASTAASALELLTGSVVDCFITEAQLEDSDCFDVLSQVQLLYPATVRFTISDDPNKEIVLENARANHRFLNKSVDVAVIASSIECSLYLHAELSDEQLGLRMRRTTSLPSLPEVYQNMMGELATPHSSLLNVGRIVEKDAALTATVLKIVNSTFYGLSQRVDSVAQAVALLGVHLIKNIALTAKVFSIFSGSTKDLRRLARLNDDACTLGALANQFARHARLSRSTVDHSQIAGMLANVGDLIDLVSDEESIGDTGHISNELLGAYLLKDWMMPDAVVEAVALQYESLPGHCEGTSPLVILHAVRYLQKKYTKISDTTQLHACSEYLGEIVEADVAELWIHAYQDLYLLTSHDDHSTHEAA